MTIRKRPAVLAAGILAASLAATVLFGSSGAGAEGTAPPWAPNGTDQDANAVGGLSFYDASGTPVTSGSTTGAPFAAYAAGRTDIRSGDIKSTLFFYVPTVGQTPDQWSTNSQIGATATYPNTSAPSNVPSAMPVYTGTSSDSTLDTLATHFPNTATTAGYQNVYEIRMYTNAPRKTSSPAYDYADISIDSTNHTWTLVWSPGNAATGSTVPSAPTNVAATLSGSTATVTWSAPTTNASSVTGYNVRYSGNNGSTWTAVTHSGTTTTQDVPLPANGTYVFDVQAIGNSGTSPYSAASNSVTYGSVPGTPGTPTAVAGNAQATITWTAPTANPGSVTGYQLQDSTNDGMAWATAATTGPTTTSRVVPLSNGMHYVFRVAATSAVGAGPYSAASNSVTPQADSTALAIRAPGSVPFRGMVTLGTTLTDTTTRSGVGGQKVTVFARSGNGRWLAVGSATTGPAGNASYRFADTATQTFQWRYAGNTTHNGSTSGSRTITVSQIVNAKDTRARVPHGKSVSFYGTVRPAGAGARVVLQELFGRTWKDTSVATRIHRQLLPDHSRTVGFDLTITLRGGGVHLFRVFRPATPTLASGFSGALRVRTT